MRGDWPGDKERLSGAELLGRFLANIHYTEIAGIHELLLEWQIAEAEDALRRLEANDAQTR